MRATEHRIKILVVEDSQLVADCFQMILSEMVTDAFDVELAYSLKMMNEVLDRFAPDVILLDINLPDGGKDRTLERILDLEQLAAVLVITGDDEFPPESVTRLGADFVFKRDVMMRPEFLIDRARRSFERQNLKRMHDHARQSLCDMREFLQKGKPDDAPTGTESKT